MNSIEYINEKLNVADTAKRPNKRVWDTMWSNTLAPVSYKIEPGFFIPNNVMIGGAHFDCAVIRAIQELEYDLPCKLIGEKLPSVYYASHINKSMKIDLDCQYGTGLDILNGLHQLNYCKLSTKSSMTYIKDTLYGNVLEVRANKISIHPQVGFWTLIYQAEYGSITLKLYPDTLLPMPTSF